MKILQVINSLGIGGAEKLVMDSTLWLSKKEDIVDVLLLNGAETDFKYALIKDGIRVFSLGNKNNIYNPILIFKIISFLKEYDLVHVHLFPAQYWVVIANFLSGSKIRLVTTEHSTSNRRRYIWAFKWIDRLIYKYYDKIIAISPQTKEALAHYIGNDEYITTIFNGVNLQFITSSLPYLKKELVGDQKAKIIIQVAGFRLEKDQDTVIDALKKLPEDVHLVLVGDGPRKVVCEEKVRRLDIESRVHFLGLRTDVPRLLKTADVVVMSSHWEGFGLAAVEGMAAGKPVIVSNVPGLAEIVKGHGLLFEKGNEWELSELLKQLFNTQDFYDKIAFQCLNRASSFSIDKMMKQYREVYKTVCQLS